MINKIYNDVFASELIKIEASQVDFYLFKINNKIISCPRMLEYNLIKQDIIDKSISNNRKLYASFFSSLISLDKTTILYSYGDSLLFKCMPQYFLNENHKMLNLDFVTNIQVLNIKEFDGFDDYLKILSRKRRYKVKKALAQNMTITQTEESSDFLLFSEMHIKQWGEKGDPSILTNSNWYDFYSKSFEAKELTLHKLQLNGETVAYHLGFVKNGIFQYLMPTYSSNFAEQSPGFILLIGLIKSAFNSDVDVFNFGSGEYSYKMWLSNNSRPIFKVTIKKERLTYVMKKTVLALKPKIKSMLKRFY